MTAQTVIKRSLTKVYNADLHKRFLLWMEESGVTAKRIAGMVNRSAAAVTSYIDQSYQGDLAAIERDVARLLKQKENTDFSASASSFVKTSVAVAIFELLFFCYQRAKFGVIFAPSGIGKTEPLRQFKKTNDGVLLASANISTRFPGTVLRLIARHSGGIPRQNSISDLLSTLCDRLKRSYRLLIIDEAHFLKWESLEAIRSIYDISGVGVILCGQERLYSQMVGTEGSGFLYDQLFSRIAIRRCNFKVKKNDVRALAEVRYPNIGEDCVEYLYQVARGKGHFRIMLSVLDIALELHEGYRNPLDIKLLQEAARFSMA
jgi:hypothetical protein